MDLKRYGMGKSEDRGNTHRLYFEDDEPVEASVDLPGASLCSDELNDQSDVQFEINEQELVDYIYRKLHGVLSGQDIMNVLDAETEYMIDKGFAVPMEEGK